MATWKRLVLAGDSDLGLSTSGGTVSGQVVINSGTNNSSLIVNPNDDDWGGIVGQYQGTTKWMAIYNSNYAVFGGESGTGTRIQSGGQIALTFSATSTYDATFSGNVTLGAKVLNFESGEKIFSTSGYVVADGDAGFIARDSGTNKLIINGSNATFELSYLNINAGGTNAAITCNSDTMHFIADTNANGAENPFEWWHNSATIDGGTKIMHLSNSADLWIGNDLTVTGAIGSGGITATGDIQAPGIYVGSTNTSYDFYNNGTTYLNGATTIDANLTFTTNSTTVDFTGSGPHTISGSGSGSYYNMNNVGTITPNSDSGFDLGSGSKYWDEAFIAHINSKDFVNIQIDDAEQYFQNTAGSDYWRLRRDASNNFILDHYDSSSTGTAMSFDSSENLTLGNQLTIPNKILHDGDTGTYIGFTDGQIDLKGSGGVRLIISDNEHINFYTGASSDTALNLSSDQSATFYGNVVNVTPSSGGSQIVFTESGGSSAYLYSGGSFSTLRVTTAHGLRFATNFASRGVDDVIIGTDGTLTRTATNSSAGTAWTAIGDGNIPHISIQNASTTNNTMAGLFFKDDQAHRAGIHAKFTNHTDSSEEAELIFSTASSGDTRERLTIKGNGDVYLSGTTLSLGGTASVDSYLRFDGASGDTYLHYNANDIIDVYTGGDIAMRIKDDDVEFNGSVQIRGSSQQLRLFNGSTEYMRFDGNVISTHGSTNFFLDAADGLIFRTNGSTERMRITSGGLVGIGTASPSTYHSSADNLVIYESANAGMTIATSSTGTGSIFFADSGTGDEAYKGVIEYNHGTNELQFRANSVVGMTLNPSKNLTVEGSGDYGGDLTLTKASGDIIFRMDNNATNGADFNINNGAGNSRVDFSVDSNQHMTLKGQKVGILTTSPTSELTVNGNVLATGTGTHTFGVNSAGGGGVLIRSLYDDNHAKLTFSTGHPSNANTWDTGQITAGDNGNYNGVMTFYTSGDGIGTGLQEAMNINGSQLTTFKGDLVIDGRVKTAHTYLKIQSNADNNYDAILQWDQESTMAWQLYNDGSDSDKLKLKDAGGTQIFEATQDSTVVTGVTWTFQSHTFMGDIYLSGGDIYSPEGAKCITVANDDTTFADDVAVGGDLTVDGAYPFMINASSDWKATSTEKNMAFSVGGAATASVSTTSDLKSQYTWVAPFATTLRALYVTSETAVTSCQFKVEVATTYSVFVNGTATTTTTYTKSFTTGSTSNISCGLSIAKGNAIRFSINPNSTNVDQFLVTFVFE